MSAATSARHSSATNEHYTPARIVEAARALLGGIDLDPASSQVAQETVQAKRWHGLDHPLWFYRDGLLTDWYDIAPTRVLLNPPGGRVPQVTGGPMSSQKAWWQKLVREYAADHVRSAVFVCFSVELLQTSQVNQVGPLPVDFPICFPSRRIAYVKPDGTVGASPPHSSCIVYLPPKGQLPSRYEVDFREAFGWLGAIK